MKRKHLLLGAVCFVLAGLAFVLLESFTPKNFPAAPGQAHSADEETQADAAEADAWAQAWVNQEQYLQTIVTAASTLRKDIPEITRQLQNATTPFETEVRRLFVLSNTYAKNPRVLEAVARRIASTGDALDASMRPVKEAKEVGQELLEKVTQLEKTLPTGVRDGTNTTPVTKELRPYMDTLAQAKKRLTDSLARLNAALVQPTTLREKVSRATTNIEAYLPGLWKQQYINTPTRYTDKAQWEEMRVKLADMAHNFALRLDMEIPTSAAGWTAVCGRFATVLIFGSLLALLLRRRWKRRQGMDETSAENGTTSAAAASATAENGEQDDATGHVPVSIFYTSVPWLLIGVALVITAVSATPDKVYHGLLAVGNLMLIVGQISLAWGMRQNHCELCPKLSPFWPMCLTTLTGYILLYPELPVSLQAGIWLGVLVLAILWQRRKRPEIPLQLERGVLKINGVVLWLALFTVVLGLPRYSILLYILFSSLAVALQLGMGGMYTLHQAAQKMPQEGAKAVLGSLWLACAAPSMVILVVLGVALWVVTMPGGYYLLHSYASTGISVGETRFNILQLLLILSVFYITRTAANMGSSFLAKMPSRGIRIDASLIPPLQTAFSYSLWALFGLFVLKSLGMELSNLAVVAGGLSVGIGFGMQAIVNNFLSGLILIFSRILQEGDVVDVGGLTGTVRKINVRATTVETYDNAVIYVPNSEFVSNRLINWTRNSRSVRSEITVGVAYGSDTDLVMKLLRDAANTNPGVLKYPAPSVIFANFGNNTLDFILRFWVHDFDAGVPTASELRHDIEKIFCKNNVEVAFPQLDVHIKEVPRGIKTPKRKALPATTPATRVEPARRLEDMDKERHHAAALPARAGVRRLVRRRKAVSVPAAVDEEA